MKKDPFWAEWVPSSCTHCGISEREHAQRWTQEAGWHKWERPTDEQILYRMYRRRAMRKR